MTENQPSARPWANALRRLLENPELHHDEALIGLAVVLGDADSHELWACLDDACRPLFGLAAGDLHEQAEALADVTTNRLGLTSATGGYETLLLNHALANRAAHPMLLATLGRELARHAGLDSLVARSSTDYWTVLIQEDTFLPIGYSPHCGLSASKLRACCAHEIAYETLLAVAATAPRDKARQANQLRAVMASCI
jgi:hypothetical protein